jgi:transcriptional regulator with GAF, ATPase, and Fis domain
VSALYLCIINAYCIRFPVTSLEDRLIFGLHMSELEPSIEAQKRSVAERALAAVKSLTNSRTAALFTVVEGHLQLFASATLDQNSLELSLGVWTRHEDSLRRGEMFYSPELHTDRRMSSPSAKPAAVVIVPAFSGEQLVALLYADSLEPYFCTRHDQQRLADLSTLVGKALGAKNELASRDANESWAEYLEASDPIFNKQRDELLLLLNRTDWNIARVARILGVSRRTLYVRLEKYRIPREHVEKRGTGGRRTGRGSSETRTYPRFGSTFIVRQPPLTEKAPGDDDGETQPE